MAVYGQSVVVRARTADADAGEAGFFADRDTISVQAKYKLEIASAVVFS